jgi:hypothetical protein
MDCQRREAGMLAVLTHVLGAGTDAPDVIGFVKEHPVACAVIAVLLLITYGVTASKTLSGGAKCLGVLAALAGAFFIWNGVRQTDAAVDVTANPTALFDTRVTAGNVTCKGVRLGDSWDAMRQKVTDELKVVGQPSGMREAWGPEGLVWAFQGDTLVGILIHDRNILSKLNLRSRADIETRFGKADRISERTRPTGLFGTEPEQWTYHYDRRGFSVEWLADGGLNRLQLQAAH